MSSTIFTATAVRVVPPAGSPFAGIVGRQVTVPLAFAGTPVERFLWDTGAHVSLIDRNRAARFGVRLGPAVPLGFVMAGGSAATVGHISEMSFRYTDLPGWSFTVPVAVLPSRPGFRPVLSFAAVHDHFHYTNRADDDVLYFFLRDAGRPRHGRQRV